MTLSKAFLALFLIAAVTAKPQWRDDVKGRYYLIERDQKYNWFEAYHECGRLGLNLVEIDSEEKNDSFKQMLKRVLGKPINLWIGGNDHYNTAKDLNRPFYLLASGKRLEFTYWNNGEPNNERGEEHCIHIDSNAEDFKWNDIQCNNHKHGFVCELHSIAKMHDDFLSEKRQLLRKTFRTAFNQYKQDFSRVTEQLKQNANVTETKTNEMLVGLQDMSKRRDEATTLSAEMNYDKILAVVDDAVNTTHKNVVDVVANAEKARREFMADSEDVKDIVDETIAGHAPYRNRQEVKTK